MSIELILTKLAESIERLAISNEKLVEKLEPKILINLNDPSKYASEEESTITGGKLDSVPEVKKEVKKTRTVKPKLELVSDTEIEKRTEELFDLGLSYEPTIKQYASHEGNVTLDQLTKSGEAEWKNIVKDINDKVVAKRAPKPIEPVAELTLSDVKTAMDGFLDRVRDYQKAMKLLSEFKDPTGKPITVLTDLQPKDFQSFIDLSKSL